MEIMLGTMAFHLHTLWMFTSDSLLDTVIPCTVFAICCTLSNDLLHLPVLTESSVLLRLPHVVVWLWLLVLQFCIHNQSSRQSIKEDLYNKPWRPLPAGRITIQRSHQVLRGL
ncbi:hypothetical protein DM02DRAFT_603295 [Periconia macrospinosa]|uniref:Uncharacterized protein n=1 Tax=Periconia macrospinosa TaxID=97972 RepID=A0A2V1D7A0_9PLEO|nr:hypothetical protein DM02DRAFT_603295 [Periconia macrospinosa]